MPNVLVTMPFDEGLLDRLRAVSPDLAVTRGDPARGRAPLMPTRTDRDNPKSGPRQTKTPRAARGVGS